MLQNQFVPHGFSTRFLKLVLCSGLQILSPAHRKVKAFGQRTEASDCAEIQNSTIERARPRKFLAPGMLNIRWSSLPNVLATGRTQRNVHCALPGGPLFPKRGAAQKPGVNMSEALLHKGAEGFTV